MKMVSLFELLSYTNELLQIHKFQDYCPNGLQVEGKKEISKIVSGVTACQALLDEACDQHADLILVHHGVFWKNEDPCIVGIKRKRLIKLLENQINLLAYHLPLDMHAKLGNNVQLAKLLSIQIKGELVTQNKSVCGLYGDLVEPVPATEFKKRIETQLERDCMHVECGTQNIQSIGMCTGAGQSFISLAVDMHLDAYISGEISEQTTHIAREQGIHYFAAGHHATERYGVQALADHLANKFQLEHNFVDISNPA